MCKYCDDKSGLVTIGFFKATMRGIHYGYDIYVYNDNLRIGDDSREFEINYCPMCGRKLVQDETDS